MLEGKGLINDIDAYQSSGGEFAIWWLGQGSFIVKLARSLIYIDPYLTGCPDRKVPPLLEPQDLANGDLILGTHDHDDHIDRGAWPAVAASAPKVKFVVPELLLRGLAGDLNIPRQRFVAMDDNRSVQIDDIRITGIAAAHEFLDQDQNTGFYPYLGYVIEANGCTIYAAGDTCNYEGLQTKLSRWKFDLALLPINGRSAAQIKSDIVGNMTYQEAADLAGALKPALTIPTHYDMFEGNTEDPRLFTDYMNVKYPGLKVCVCEYSKCTVVSCCS